MRRIIICADDYALAPGVSEAIRALIAARRINATSVMTVFPGLPEEAGRLRIAAQGTGASIGLHVTLTAGFAPLRAAPLGGTSFPSMGRLLVASLTGRVSRESVRTEVEAQFDAFEAAFGMAPAHVDGHQHAHLLPVIRDVVLDTAARRAPRALVRDCTQAPGARIGFDAKGRFISLLASGLAGQARRRGLRVNSGFSGAYALRTGGDFAALFGRFAAGLGDGGMMMVHPGHVDGVLQSRDPVHAPREAEYRVLAGPDFGALLAKAGVTLA
ncbi:ChbG/HpnK family deacetylase [Aquabacter cavernae]|uniref:ChbG/HpnK family deacetylase n=1 Tax=Aquabacter cavernae TaxID=2496029 RepID=UPI0013DFD24E|nr:ChbG/HpnK family deacetylase [Aquabacter cavernae]